MRPDPTQAYEQAPLEHLIALALRQFRRLLAGRGIALGEDEVKALASQAVDRAVPDPKRRAVCEALAELVAESEQVLARWNLTFAQALTTGMDAIPGWETTAEFLEIANEKSSAELRIATGAALLAAFGDLRYARYLLDTVEHGAGDVDAIIARRVLLFVSGLDGNDPDWLAKVRAWLASAGGT